MEKKICNVTLILCFITLLINTVEINQIRTQLKPSGSLIQKIIYNFPKEIKQNQKITDKNNIELTIRDKNIVQKISAPVVKVSYNIWGEPYSENRYYTAKDSDNRLVYANLNVKSLYKKKADLKELISAKIIYDGKYEFDCFSIKTTKDQSDFISDISLMPLDSENIYFVAELPKNFTETKKSIKLELETSNKKYVTKLR